MLQLISPRVVGIIIDSVTANNADPGTIIILLGLMVVTALLIYWLRYVWRILLFGAAYRLAVELRSKLYKMLSQQLPEFYLRHRTGDLMARATNDVDRVVFAAGEGVLTLVDSLVMGGSVLLVMSFQISWQLTLLALLPMLVMALLIKQYGQRLHQRFRIAQAAFSTLNNQAQDNLTSIRMIKAFGLEQHQTDVFSKVAAETGAKNMHVAWVDARFDPTIYLTVSLSNLLAIMGGSLLVKHNTITIGQLTSFIMYLGLMIWPMLALAWLCNIVERGSAAYNRICQTLDEASEVTDEGTLMLPAGHGTLQVAVRRFGYPQCRNAVLTDIQFTLAAGQILGLCGPTGAGKSTLLALIQRHFAVSEGEISFHNLPLNAIDIEQWRSRLAVVNQTPFMFYDSVANNIALGRPDATLQQLMQVAELACVHEDILRLPQGYQTEVGERGVMLSGGQKQRLALARALLLEEAEIIVLDDALSAVDSRTEYMILQHLLQWVKVKERTVIITAHRLSALQYASEILVLNNGIVSQRGRHQQLLQQPGWYRDIYRYQQLSENSNV